ncbi:MAG: hypothetical protein K6C94_02890 [Candidatus Gastranaerophilales bacterium]|nr:hypothetical protein [Candidatus Gastranaerophilales bacterium]
MMKKIFCLFIIFIIFALPSFSEQCGYNYECPQIERQKSALDSFFAKFNGIDYIQIKFAEIAIEQYIKQKLNNDVSVSIKTESAKALKNGEFEQITVSADKIFIDKYVLSDFYAQTICPYNKIIIDNGDFKFPYDVAANFSACIENDDLNTIVSQYLGQINSKYGGLLNVNCFLANSKLNIFISTPLLKQNYVFSTGLAVNNGNIIFTDLNQYADSIYLKNITSVLSSINPVYYRVKIASNTYCFINLQTLSVLDDKIYLQGLFIIPKNCGITE